MPPRKRPAASPRVTRSSRRPQLPEPAFIEPMAALAVTELPEGDDWLYEVKWDGYRALGRKHGDVVDLISRNQKSLSADFPQVLALLERLNARSALLDGEIVAIGEDGRPSFQALQNRASVTPQVAFYAFDLLHLDGVDLTQLPLDERKARLVSVAAGSGVLLSAELPGAAADVLAAIGKMGLEGVVAKRRSSIYQSGERNGDWKKLRLGHEQEFVVGGFRPGLVPFESLLVGVYEGERLLYCGKVRPGLTPRSRAALWELMKDEITPVCPFANLPNTDKKGRWGEGVTAAEMATLRWVKPRQVVQITFTEWTARGGLRHASFKGLRHDKQPRDVVRET